MKFPIRVSATGMTRKGSNSRGITRESAKAMAQIAKKVVFREAETKSALLTWDQTLFDDLAYGLNLTHAIAQGTGVQQRIGQKINLKNFYIKGKLTAINNATVGNGTTLFRLMIVKSDQEITISNATLTKSDIFRGTTNNVSSRGFPDLSKISVVYDRQFLMKADIQNANEHIPFTLNKKIGKKVFFNQDSQSYLKSDQYYLLITASKTDGSAANCGFLNCQIAINFKDE